MRSRLLSLAVAYAVLAGLAAPAMLFAAEDPVVPPVDPPAVEVPPVDGSAPPADASAGPAADAAAEPPATEAPATNPQPEAQSAEEARPVARAAASASVTIKDFSFAPRSVTVSVGDSVTWTNQGPSPHSATADDGSFDTGVFGRGQSRTRTFTKAGTFSYFCEPHPFMKGTVRVTAAGSGGQPQRDDAPRAGGDDQTSEAEAARQNTGSSRSGLPATGLDAGLLAALGLGLLGLGLAARRRTAV